MSSKENMPFDILSCIGNVSIKDSRPFIDAHIILSDQNGSTAGGRLFSKTAIFKGQIKLREVIGDPFKRSYDNTTGLFLWK